MIYFKFIHLYSYGTNIYLEPTMWQVQESLNFFFFFFKADKERSSFEFNSATTYFSVVTVYVKG